MTRDDNVVRVGFGYSGGNGANAAFGNQLDANGSARIYPLEVEDQLRQIFDGVNVVVRWRTDERDAGLGVAQTGDQLGDLVTGELTTFAGLGALGDFDFDFLGMGEVFGGDPEASGRHLLHLVIQDGRSAGIVRVDNRVFPALAGIGAASEPVHGFGDGLVGFRTQRAERHGGSNEAAHDGGCGFHLVEGQRSRGGPDLQQVAQHGGLALDGQGAEGIPGLDGRQAGGSRTASTPGYDLQSLDSLRLPEVRLSMFVFAEADPTIVREGFGYRLLSGGCGRLRLLMWR